MRLSPLPNAAHRLLWMSQELTLGQKAVWQQLAAFPETGCYMSAAALGRRIALAGEYVERTRRELKELGLARIGQRQPPTGKGGKRGRPAQTWFAVFPEALMPPSRTPTDTDLANLLPGFDAYLRERRSGVTIPTEESGNSARVSRSLSRENPASVAGGPSRGEGGRGEGSPHSHPVGTTANPSCLPTSGSGHQRAGEAEPVAAPVRRALAPTLAGTGTAEVDRTIEREGGRTRLAPPDLAERLDAWHRRLSGGGADR